MPTEDLELVAQELSKLQREVRRRRWRTDPVAWAQERLGDNLWSKQQEIIHSVAKFRRVAVRSCHEIGKSYIASVIVGWWLDTNPVGEAFVVTSAPTGNQVKAILWREIGRVHARGNLAGRVNQTEWFMKAVAGNEELVAFGRKPDDYDPTAFQGIHARRVLIIFDEACGIPLSLFEAGDSLIANDLSKALAIGNPDNPMTEFAEICKPGSGWKVIGISAFDSPNFTGEKLPVKVKDQLIGRTYVEEKRRKWAPHWGWNEQNTRVVPPEGSDPQDTNPLWQSKVLGEFPRTSDEGGLIPIQWISRAQQAALLPDGPHEAGLDVGGGGDSSCLCEREGPVARIRWEDRNPDTMQTCGKLVSFMQERKLARAKIDMIGIGKGVYDRAREQKLPVVGISTGEQAFDNKRFVNRRSELGWQLRERFEAGEIDIDERDDDLAAELVSLRYKRTSTGKIQLETKDEAKKRGVKSPNRADALILAFAEPKKVPTKATWGR